MTTFGTVVRFVLCLLTAATTWGASPGELLERAIYLEETKGDLQAAIQLYDQIAADPQVDRSLSAQARTRQGFCELKLGNKPQAVSVLEQLTVDFPDKENLLTILNDHMPRLLEQMLQVIEHNYIQEVNRGQLMETAMRAIVGQLDAGGKVFRPDDMAFLGPNELNQMHEQIRQQVVGIGAILKLDPDSGEVVVTSPMPDSPALKGGLEPGDIIASVDGMDLPDAKRLEAAVKQLRGPAGTAVTVGVRRSGSEEVKSVKLVRDVVRLPSVKGDRLKPDLTWDFMLDYQSKIGYVRLTQLGNRSPDEMRAALEELRSLGLAALILDLRNNPGGTLADAVAVADLFVQSGTIVTVKGRSGTQEFAATAEETFAGFPMAVLVNHRTASAAEIVAACLQDHKRAVIIGERTYGQALVRSMIPLEGGAGALKLPTAEYLRPSGRNVNRYPDARDSDEWGVSPDDGFELQFSEEEARKYLSYRNQRDLPAPPDSRELSFDDRQLQLAIDSLKSQLKKR
jgi:carboxyl-terminal processing protease